MQSRWWQQAVVYQIYPRSFMDSDGDGIGDLPGILARLDYLQWLGVDVLWLCPIFRSPNDDNGYDISDYCAIMAEFGTMDDFDRLLADAHRRGMRVILDLVINHTSDEHPWFIESRSSRENPKRDWYFWRDGGDRGSPPNNWESIFRGPAWTYDAATGQWYLHLFTRRQPDLNWDNAALRAAVSDMMRWWLDKGVDGFRIDAITHLKKAPGLPDMPNPQGLAQVPAYPFHMNVDGILDYIDELCTTTLAGRDVMTVGEANGIGPGGAEEWVGATRGRLSMVLQFEHWHLWSNAPRAPLDVRTLKRILGRWQTALRGRGWNALYLENHDLPRVVSRWGEPQRWRVQSATALATMYFLMEGTPFIYQGQELGLPNAEFASLDEFQDTYAHNRIAEMRAKGLTDDAILDEMRHTGRDTSRTPMPWDDGPHAGFTAGRPWLPAHQDFRDLNVVRQQGDRHSVLNYYRALIELRKREPVLLHGRYRTLAGRSTKLYAYTRGDGDDAIAVICNLSGEPATYRHAGFTLDRTRLLLANHDVPPHGPLTALTLRAWEARVYRIGTTSPA
ncbi:alpha-glucosidase [Azoarcus sp. KH32C]|uniref:glycoside hydrolase family 13 protein n=1 Tax=Azoarcus sp. KH32C TaxID=748247 RepID=UPI0002386BE9|nr:alpha-glucosidase [Azoarcus sp. KH32C]BAL26554.1 alpha-D-1,4-glucosidase [Azoarcus sp. KH32C]